MSDMKELGGIIDGTFIGADFTKITLCIGDQEICYAEDFYKVVENQARLEKSLTETQQALKQAINALTLLTEAKYIKDNFGKYGNYEQLKDSAWEAAKAALASIDKEGV